MNLELDETHHDYARRYADLTDEQIFAHAAHLVSRPKQDPANSFILHAPLELMARRDLLRYAAPAGRDAVRRRMLWVADTYERAAVPLEAGTRRLFDSPAAARSALADAIQQKDLDTTDAAARWLGVHVSTDDVMALAESVIDSLAAAGHASIYFFLLGRTAANNRAALSLMRPLVREIARLPELRIEWIRGGVDARSSDGHRLAAALAGVPRLGLPGSDFIFPTVHQVDSGGQARALIDGSLPSDLTQAGTAIVRVAALSMLQDDPVYAPYGWSHCLTLPQSVLGIAPWLSTTTTATAIAATYVTAFRAAESSHDVDVEWKPEPTNMVWRDALDADPSTAASATYHASDEQLDAIVPELAARAGSHEDAHLAEYTLARLHAAADDPSQRRLYLAAAAYLRAWWAAAA